MRIAQRQGLLAVLALLLGMPVVHAAPNFGMLRDGINQISELLYTIVSALTGTSATQKASILHFLAALALFSIIYNTERIKEIGVLADNRTRGIVAGILALSVILSQYVWHLLGSAGILLFTITILGIFLFLGFFTQSRVLGALIVFLGFFPVSFLMPQLAQDLAREFSIVLTDWAIYLIDLEVLIMFGAFIYRLFKGIDVAGNAGNAARSGGSGLLNWLRGGNNAAPPGAGGGGTGGGTGGTGGGGTGGGTGGTGGGGTGGAGGGGGTGGGPLTVQITQPAADAPDPAATRPAGDHTPMRIEGVVSGGASPQYDYLFGLYDASGLVAELPCHAGVNAGTAAGTDVDLAGLALVGGGTGVPQNAYLILLFAQPAGAGPLHPPADSSALPPHISPVVGTRIIDITPATGAGFSVDITTPPAAAAGPALTIPANTTTHVEGTLTGATGITHYDCSFGLYHIPGATDPSGASIAGQIAGGLLPINNVTPGAGIGCNIDLSHVHLPATWGPLPPGQYDLVMFAQAHTPTGMGYIVDLAALPPGVVMSAPRRIEVTSPRSFAAELARARAHITAAEGHLHTALGNLVTLAVVDMSTTPPTFIPQSYAHVIGVAGDPDWLLIQEADQNITDASARLTDADTELRAIVAAGGCTNPTEQAEFETLASTTTTPPGTFHQAINLLMVALMGQAHIIR